jgi:hypothetical protein
MAVLTLAAGTDKELSRQSIFTGHLSNRACPEPGISKNCEPQGARKQAEFMRVMRHRHGAVSGPEQKGVVGASTRVVGVRIA